MRTNGKYASSLHHSFQLAGDPIFSLSKNVATEQGGIHSIDELDDDLLEWLSMPRHVSRFMVYNNGRIAWWPSAFSAPYLAVVDDLRTAQRRVYQFPDHGKMDSGYKTAMSDQLLVLGREKTIHAWHFERDVLASVVVPEPYKRCIVEGSVVLIVTHYAEVFKWEFGGKLEQMSFSSLGCYQPGPIYLGGLWEAPLEAPNPLIRILRHQGLVLQDTGMLLDFIIHQTNAHVFFIVTKHEGHLIVHEVEHGRLVQSYPLHDGATSSVERWKQIYMYLRWERCDSYGGYRLLYVYLGVNDELSPADLQTPEEPRCGCWRKTGLVSVCFNIYTKLFDVQVHHLLHQHDHEHLGPVPAELHLWDKKIYTSYTPTTMQEGMPITALRSCRAGQDPPHSPADGSVPVYTTSDSSRGILARRHAAFPDRLLYAEDSPAQRTAWRDQIAFGFDVTSQYAPGPVRSSARHMWPFTRPAGNHFQHVQQVIVGDDDFLIYVADGVYMVWSFGDEISVSKAGAGKWAPWRKTQ